MRGQEVRAITGRALIAARRIYHEFDGVIDRSAGPLELSWADGGVTLIDGVVVTISLWEGRVRVSGGQG